MHTHEFCNPQQYNLVCKSDEENRDFAVLQSLVCCNLVDPRKIDCSYLLFEMS